MKLFTYPVYCGLSVLAFSIVASRSWKVHHRFFDLCVDLVENPTYSLIGANLCFAMIHFLFLALLTFSFGPTPKQCFQKAIESALHVLADLIMLIITAHVGTNGALSPSFLLILYLRYVAIIVQQRILNLPLSITRPTRIQHERMLTLQIVVFFVSWYATLYYLRETLRDISRTESFLFVISAQGMFDCVLDIVRHIIYILDRENSGNSKWAFNLSTMIELGFQVAYVIFDGCVIAYMTFKYEFSFYMWRPIVASSMAIYKKIKALHQWRKLKPVLREKMFAVTEADLENDDTCIICRLPMTIPESVKLPCNHCLHIDCLERWMYQKLECPICQKDFSHIMNDLPEPHAPTDQPEEEDLPQEETFHFEDLNQPNADPLPVGDAFEAEDEADVHAKIDEYQAEMDRIQSMLDTKRHRKEE